MTAIVSAYYFIRAGDVADTFGIARVLVEDEFIGKRAPAA
jgi:hypothetical protein